MDYINHIDTGETSMSRNATRTALGTSAARRVGTKTAGQAYAEKRTEIDGLLAQLQQHLIASGNAAAADPRNWGHVGDLGHIADCLRNALGIEG